MPVGPQYSQAYDHIILHNLQVAAYPLLILARASELFIVSYLKTTAAWIIRIVQRYDSGVGKEDFVVVVVVGGGGGNAYASNMHVHPRKNEVPSITNSLTRNTEGLLSNAGGVVHAKEEGGQPGSSTCHSRHFATRIDLPEQDSIGPINGAINADGQIENIATCTGTGDITTCRLCTRKRTGPGPSTGVGTSVHPHAQHTPATEMVEEQRGRAPRTTHHTWWCKPHPSLPLGQST